MSVEISGETRRTCDAYVKAIAAGEEPADVVGYLSAQYGVHRPAIWKRLRRGGIIPGYKAKDEDFRAYAGLRKRHKHDRIESLPPVQNRDPCHRCGVRRDIGCHHSLAPLGMMM